MTLHPPAKPQPLSAPRQTGAALLAAMLTVTLVATLARWRASGAVSLAAIRSTKTVSTRARSSSRTSAELVDRNSARMAGRSRYGRTAYSASRGRVRTSSRSTG